METPWKTSETNHQLTIVHDNRWLAIFGIPISLFGLLVAIGPWFIDSARESGAWPILAGGSLIGTGIFVAGLSLCFKYESVTANTSTGEVVRHKGLAPFRRTAVWPIEEFQQIACRKVQMAGGAQSHSSIHYQVRLKGDEASTLLASCLDSEPIQAEARRWATFLNLPISDSMNVDLASQLADHKSKN